MGKILIPGGGGEAGSDECTAILAHVLAGETAVTADSGDEPGVGTMEVNSLLSFSVAAYSGRQVLVKWQNPYAAVGKPYSGVIIRYSTTGYPGVGGGAQIYKGAGNNVDSGGQSQAYIDLPALNTTYYLSAYPYATCSAGDLTGSVLNATIKTANITTVTVKGTQNYTIPAGYTNADLFAVGGGSGGRARSTISGRKGGGGGAGGFTSTAMAISIESGQVLSIIIGAGGAQSNGGGLSSVSRGGAVLVSAAGGGTNGGSEPSGCPGGSGGGAAGADTSVDAYRSYIYNGAAGGADGGNGMGTNFAGGSGQGKTTRAFGEPTGTLYAGGGGGGAGASRAAVEPPTPGAGGMGGGGTGGGVGNYMGVAGGANTGGGGGGAHTYNGADWGAAGGSGVVLIRLY